MAAVSCKFCLDEVAANEWAAHIAKKTHQDNLPSKLLLKGSFKSSRLAEIDEYFSRFGKIAKREIVVGSREFVNLIKYSYENPMSYCTVVHCSEHSLWGQKLDINWCKNSCLEEIPKIEDVPSADLKASINELLSESQLTFTDQVATLKTFLQSNTTKIEIAKKAIRDDLSMILSLIPGFDSTRINFFGSTVMDLAIPGSNLDINVHSVSEASVLGLLAKTSIFADVRKTEGNFPVIRCRHVPTNMVCHLRIGDKLPVRTSELIKYYVRLDESAHSLMLVIKIWAKYHDLKASGYVLYLLVLFFMQQKPYDELPRVVDLQNDVPPDCESGWNCALPTIPVQCSSQSSSIANLVMDFFKFYENFDYIGFILAPYYASVFQKISFLQPYHLPAAFYHRYKELNSVLDLDCGICIQDPFEHSRCISLESSLKSSGNFTWCCRESLSFFKKNTRSLHDLLNKSYKKRVLTIPWTLNTSQCMSFVLKGTQNILTEILAYKILYTNNINYDYTMKCSGDYDVWTNRVQTTKNLRLSEKQKQIDVRKLEVTASDILIKKRPENKSRSEEIIINITFKYNIIRLSLTGNNHVGAHLDHFLRVEIPKVVKMWTGKPQAADTPKVLDGPKTSDTPGAFNEFRKVHAKGDEGADFSQQVSDLLAHFPCNSLELKAGREVTLKDFLLAVKYIIPVTKIHFYGSAVTGLQIPQSSPIDIYFEGQPSSDALTKNVLQKNTFYKVLLIPAKEKQMVKFKHRKTHITVRAFIGVQVEFKTDQLIQYYISLDEKIRTLMLVLKYWLRCQSQTQNFTSCVLYMLVIFYLQQEPYKLPTVVDLQRDACLKSDRSWDYAFTPIEVSSTSLQSATLFELVEGFFRFYESFDHVSYVLSLFAGYAIAKIDFLAPYNLPSFYRSFVDMNAVLDVGPDMCLQDPFDHSQNLTKCCGAYWGSYFASLCRKALPLMRREYPLYNICCGQSESKPLPEIIFFKNCFTQTFAQSFSLEKPEGYSDEEFSSCVEQVFRYTLTNVLHCGPNKSNKDDQPVYEYSSTVWEDRDKVLKSLVESLSANATDVEKETAISKSIPPKTGAVNYCTVSIHWKLEGNPVRAVFTVTGINDWKERRLGHLTHYLRVKMDKFMQEVRTNQVYIEDDSEFANVGNSKTENPDPTVAVTQSEEEGAIFDDEDEDDIPDNFFDDFADEDFLDGLELVLDDNLLSPESSVTSVSEVRRSSSRGRSSTRETTGSDDGSKKRSISRDPPSRTNQKRKSSSDSRSRNRSRSKRRRTRFSSPEPAPAKASEKSFLEEIRDKVNGGGSAPQIPYTQLSKYDIFSIRPLEQHRVADDDPIHEQFAQKKISLADYLTVLSKRQETPALTPEQLQMKTKVLNRCEEFLQGRPSGPLRVRPSPPRKIKPGRSPIQRSKVKFKFTSPPRGSDGCFLNVLYAALERIGIFGKAYDNERLFDSVAEALSSDAGLDSNLAAQVLQVSLMGAKNLGNCGRRKGVSVSTQTECDDDRMLLDYLKTRFMTNNYFKR